MKIREPDKAFSLLELLVVIAGIVVLVSLLGSVYGMAAAESRAMRCLTNMRQLSQIFLRYSVENNNDLVPAVILLPPGYTTGQTWMVHLDERGYLIKETYHEIKNGVMSCPSRSTPGSYAYSKTHYAVNRNMGFDNVVKKGAPFHKVSRIAVQSKTMLLGESEGAYMIQSHSDVFLEHADREKRRIAFPHRERANVIFMDGHAERLSGPWQIPKKGASAPFYGSD